MGKLERQLKAREFRFTSLHLREAGRHTLARTRSKLATLFGQDRRAAPERPAAGATPPVRDTRGRPSWHRGPSTNFLPSKAQMAEPDAIERYILKGWAPKAPFITRDMYVTTFGSCFAEHVTRFLYTSGYRVFGRNMKQDSYIIRCGEGLVNTFAILQQFQWAFGEKEFGETLWHDKNGAVLDYDESVRLRTREILLGTDVFIITLGLSEIWYDRATGDAFWRAVPADQFDAARHAFRVSTTEENRHNLADIRRLIRAHRPDAAIVFTLSPVPLTATFRDVSCLTANAVSKAVLRVAVDEFMRDNPDDGRLFYFPSYEIVQECFADPYEDDNRHVRPDVIAAVMEQFSRTFLI